MALQREVMYLEMELQQKRADAAIAITNSQEGKLCATPYGVDVVGITEAIALAGALFGGISARQRKIEVEELNEKLRTINVSLRQQARSGMMYAPGLNYVPAPAPASARAPPPPAPAPVAAPAAVAVAPVKPRQPLPPLGPPPEAPVDEVRAALREGRAKLKEGNGAAGMVFFNKAKMISKMKGDKVQLRRAMRGLAACRRLAGDKLGAIDDLKYVLQLSKDMNDFTGDADALGAIADMFTELGDLEKAGHFYDKYIKVLNSDNSGEVD